MILSPYPFLSTIDDFDSEMLEGVQSLAKREIIRMKDFAAIAENPFDSDKMISDLMKAFNIQPDELNEEGDDDDVY